MYLSQVFSSKNKIVYGIASVLLLLMFFAGIFDSSAEAESYKDMKEMVERFGELPVYAIMLFSFAFLLAPLFFVVSIMHGQSITQFTTSRKKIDYQRVLFSFLVYGALMSAVIFVDYWMSPEDYVWNFQPTRFLILVVISLLLLPVQTGFEEYFFRGYFMQWLALLSKNRWVPLVVSSVLFGLVHSANPEVLKMGYGMMFFYIGAGFFFGILALMDDGLELSIGAHFSNNFFAAILVSSDYSSFQTPALFRDVSEPVINYLHIGIEYLIYAIVIFIFAKKYKWSSWKEKLFGKVPVVNDIDKIY